MSAIACPPPEIQPNRIYTATEVAQLVFRHPDSRWFLERRQRMMKEEGFPRPISKIGRPKWYGADLVAWMARDKAPAPRSKAKPPSAPNVVNFKERARAAVRRGPETAA